VTKDSPYLDAQLPTLDAAWPPSGGRVGRPVQMSSPLRRAGRFPGVTPGAGVSAGPRKWAGEHARPSGGSALTGEMQRQPPRSSPGAKDGPESVRPQPFPYRSKVDKRGMKVLLVVELLILAGWVVVGWGPDVYRSRAQRRKRRRRRNRTGPGVPFLVPGQRAAAPDPQASPARGDLGGTSVLRCARRTATNRGVHASRSPAQPRR